MWYLHCVSWHASACGAVVSLAAAEGVQEVTETMMRSPHKTIQKTTTNYLEMQAKMVEEVGPLKVRLVLMGNCAISLLGALSIERRKRRMIDWSCSFASWEGRSVVYLFPRHC